MKRIKAIVVLLLLMAGQAVAQTAEYDTDRGFIHPGGLHTQEDFDRVKAQIAAGNATVKAAYQKLTSSEYSQSGVQTYPTEMIVRGGSGENYMNAARGAAMAYQNALRWKIAGTKANANAAVRILMAWANTTKAIGGDSNYALAAGLYGYQFAQAAELMRDYDGWSRENFEAFKRWMLNVWYPSAIGFLRGRNGTWENAGKWWQAPGHYWSNWGLCNALCVISIGVLCDDVFIYNQGMSYFKYDQCGTFKDPRTEVPIKNDGLTEFLGNLVVTTYESELETGAYGLLGQLNESGRDAGHSSMSLGVALDVAKVGWNQGDDLFAYMDHRLAAGIEYLAAQSLSVEGLPWVDYIYGTNGYYYTDSRCWTMTSPAMGAQMRPYWGTVIGIYEGVKGVAMPFSEQAYANMGIDGGGAGSTSGGYDHLGFSVLMNTRDVQLCPAELVPTELTPMMTYGGSISTNLIPSLTQEKTRKLVVNKDIYHNELGGLVNTFTANNKTGVPAGTAITLKPQLPEGEEDTGNWLWNTGETTRELAITADKSFIYRVTYTNHNGVKSQLAFSIAVQGDCTPAALTPSITYNGETTNDTIVSLLYGKTCQLSVAPQCGWGTYKWSDGKTTQTITTAAIRTDNDYTVVYTNQGGATSSMTFHLHPVAAEPYIKIDDTTLKQTEAIIDAGASLTLGLTLPAAVRAANVTWSTGESGASITLEELQQSATITASFMLSNEEVVISFDVLVRQSGSVTVEDGDYVIMEVATCRLLTAHGSGQQVTFEAGDATAPAEGQKWFVNQQSERYAIISLPDSLGILTSGMLSAAKVNSYYFEKPVASDRIAIHSGASASFFKYWLVNADGTLDLTAKALTQYPFLLLPAGGETGIEEMEDAKWIKAKGAGAVYDLSGRRISVSSVLPGGIYIENGKKVFIK